MEMITVVVVIQILLIIRRMVDRTRAVLLNAHIKWSELINIVVKKKSFYHGIAQLNNTPDKDIYYRTPEEVFNSIRILHDKNYFESFHHFGYHVYIYYMNHCRKVVYFRNKKYSQELMHT